MDSDYKKYSLEQLENWVHDAVNGEASPQEIYDVIKGVVDEQYHYHKHHTGRCYELLALLNGNGKGHIPAYDEYVKGKENLVCDKEDPSPECKKSWNDFWEENYYPEEVKDDGMRPWGHSDLEYLIANGKKDKVKKWVLPVQLDGLTGDCYVNLPDNLLEVANLKEGDQIEWVDQGNGSYLLKKVEKQMTYDEAIAAGWTMTADGFWIKE